jgi:hypothetical protein
MPARPSSIDSTMRLQGHRTGGLFEALTAGPAIGIGSPEQTPGFPSVETSEERRCRAVSYPQHIHSVSGPLLGIS